MQNIDADIHSQIYTVRYTQSYTDIRYTKTKSFGLFGLAVLA